MADLTKLKSLIMKLWGDKILYYTVLGLAAYGAALAAFLLGVFLRGLNDIASYFMLAVGGIVAALVTIYELLIIVGAARSLYLGSAGSDKRRSVFSLFIAAFSIVIVAVLIFLLSSEVLG